MSMKQQIARILERYGSPIRLKYSDERAPRDYRAFLQPLRYKNKIYLEGYLSEIGYVDEGHYLYIGPPEPKLENLSLDTMLVRQDGMRLCIKRAETVCYIGEKLYVWAVLQTLHERGEPWGQ